MQNISLKKIIRGAFLVVLIMALSVSTSFAGAWTMQKGKLYDRLAFNYYFADREFVAMLIVATLCSAAAALAETTIICASTTSIENSGPFAHILPLFEKKTGIRVKVVSRGDNSGTHTKELSLWKKPAWNRKGGSGI